MLLFVAFAWATAAGLPTRLKKSCSRKEWLLLGPRTAARALGTGLCVAMARVASTSLAGRRRLWDCLAERRRLFAKVTACALLRSLAERRQLGFYCAAGRRTFQRLAGRRHLFARAWVSLAGRRQLTL